MEITRLRELVTGTCGLRPSWRSNIRSSAARATIELLVIVGIDRDNTTAVLPPERVCAAQAGLGRSSSCHESAVDVECVKAARALIETTLTIAGLLAVCRR
jgi:hypothetical protein